MRNPLRNSTTQQRSPRAQSSVEDVIASKCVMLLLQCLRKRGLGNCCVLRRNSIMVHESEGSHCNVADQTLLADVNHESNAILVTSGYLKKRGFPHRRLKW